VGTLFNVVALNNIMDIGVIPMNILIAALFILGSQNAVLGEIKAF
jgi:hypothetical protein